MNLPDGFSYIEEVLSEDQEKEWIAFAEGLAYQPFVMRGQASKRVLARFGESYGAAGGAVGAPSPLPDELRMLRDHCAAIAGYDANKFVSALVTRYPPGAAIGWHRDLPVFGPVILGVSLATVATFRLRRRSDPRKFLSLTLSPRSLYAMSGEVRTDWEHSILPVRDARYSVTFRMMRKSSSLKRRAVKARSHVARE